MAKETLHIYTRVSTQTQQDEGTSLESQKELGLKKAKDLGFIHKVWNEGGASSHYEDFANRPVLLKLLDDIDNGTVKHLWVFSNDRLSRNPVTAQTIRSKLQKNHVTLYTNTGKFDFNNHTDRFLKGVLDEFAQLENAQRAERTRYGKISRIKQGYWMGGPAPFGYTIKDKKLELHPVESKWVKKIYEWYSSGKSTEWIKSSLDKAGVQTRREKNLWSLGSIQKLLQNTHPTGNYTYVDSKTGEVIKCDCPPIVSKSLWSECQDKRKKTLERRGQNNRTKRFYMLRNLLYCGHCGSAMSGRIKEDKNEQLYYCPKKERQWVKGAPKGQEKWKRGVGCGMTRSMNIAATDELIATKVIPFAINDAVINRALKEQRQKTKTGGNKVVAKQLQIKQKQLTQEVDKTLQKIADVEAARILEKQDERISKRVLESLHMVLRQTEIKLEQCKAEIQDLKSEEHPQKWKYLSSSERKTFTVHMKEGPSPLGMQRWIQSIVERIDATYNKDKSEHELIVRFKLPLYDGRTDLSLKLKKNKKAA